MAGYLPDLDKTVDSADGHTQAPCSFSECEQIGHAGHCRTLKSSGHSAGSAQAGLMITRSSPWPARKPSARR